MRIWRRTRRPCRGFGLWGRRGGPPKRTVEEHLFGLAALRLAARRARQGALGNDLDLLHGKPHLIGDGFTDGFTQPPSVGLEGLGADHELLFPRRFHSERDGVASTDTGKLADDPFDVL